MKLAYILITCISVLGFFACTNRSSKNELSTKKEPIEAKVEQDEKKENQSQPETKKGTYTGAWFKIEYPGNFSASPLLPKMTEDSYEYIETDEALFTSPDKSASFFVYSPQWSGEPKDYLNCASNEKLVSERTQKDPKDAESTTTWLTFAAKDGSYSRSVISKRRLSTHLVFGIQYKDTETLKKYQADFEAFKKSLIQYAD